MAIDLSSIVKQPGKKPPRIILYGVPGIGKTTFAAQFPGPIFLLTEDGLGNLEVPHFPVLNDWQSFKDCLVAVCEQKHGYKTIVVDTINRLERIIFDQVALDQKKANIEEIGYGKGYILALSYWSQMLVILDWLRENKGTTIVLTCHSIVKAHNAPETDPYDRWRFDLHDKSASILRDWADIILFANYRVFTKRTGEGFSERAKGIGTGERVIYTEERPAFWAKNRYSLPFELEFNFKVFDDAMKRNEKNNKEKKNGN